MSFFGPELPDDPSLFHTLAGWLSGNKVTNKIVEAIGEAMYAAAGPSMQQEMIEAAIEGRGVTLEEIDSDDEDFEDEDFLTPDSQEFEDAEEISATDLAETRKRARETAVEQSLKKAKTAEQKANLREQEVAVVGKGARLQPRGSDSNYTSFFRAATGSASAEVAQLNSLSDTQISVDTSVAIFKGMGNALGMLIKFMWYLLGGFTYLVGKVQMSEGSNKDALRIDSPISNTVVMVSGRMNNMWLRPRHATNWVQWLSVFTQIFMTLMGVSYYYQMMNWGLFAAGFEGVGIGYAGYVATKKVLHSDEGEILTGIALEALKGKAYKDMGAKFRSQGAVVNAVGRVAIMLANKSIGKAGPAGAVGSWFIRKGMVTASRREKRAMVRNGIVNITKTMIAAATGMVNPAHQKLHNFGLDNMQNVVKTLIPQTRRNYQEQSLKYKLGLSSEPPVSEASAVKQWAKAVREAAKIKEKAKAIVRRHTTEQSLDSIRTLLDVEDADYDQVLPVTAGMIAGLEVIGNDLSLAKEDSAKVLGLIIDQMHDSALMAAFDRLHAAGHTYGESYDFDVQKVYRDIVNTLDQAKQAVAMISKLYKQIRGLQQATGSTQTKETSDPKKQLLDIVIFIGQMRMQSTARLAERMVMMEELLMQHVYASSDDEDTRRQLQQYFKHFAAMGFHMQQDTHNAIHDAHAVHNTGSTPQRSSSSMDVLRIHSTHRQPPAEIYWDHPQHQQMIDLYQEASAPSRNRRDAQKLANNTGYIVRPSIRTEDEEKAYNRQKNAQMQQDKTGLPPVDPAKAQTIQDKTGLPPTAEEAEPVSVSEVEPEPTSELKIIQPVDGESEADEAYLMRIVELLKTGAELTHLQEVTITEIMSRVQSRTLNTSQAELVEQIQQLIQTKKAAPMPDVPPPTTATAPAAQFPGIGRKLGDEGGIELQPINQPKPVSEPVDLLPGARAPNEGPLPEIMEEPPAVGNITESGIAGEAGLAAELEGIAAIGEVEFGVLGMLMTSPGFGVQQMPTRPSPEDFNSYAHFKNWLEGAKATNKYMGQVYRDYQSVFAGSAAAFKNVKVGTIDKTTAINTRLFGEVSKMDPRIAEHGGYIKGNWLNSFFTYGPALSGAIKSMQKVMDKIEASNIPNKEAFIARQQLRNQQFLTQMRQEWKSHYFNTDRSNAPWELHTIDDHTKGTNSTYWSQFANPNYDVRKWADNTGYWLGANQAKSGQYGWSLFDTHELDDMSFNDDLPEISNSNWTTSRNFAMFLEKQGFNSNQIDWVMKNASFMYKYGGNNFFKQAFQRGDNDNSMAVGGVSVRQSGGSFKGDEPKDAKYYGQSSYYNTANKIVSDLNKQLDQDIQESYRQNQKPKYGKGQPTQFVPGAGVIMDTGTGTHTHTLKKICTHR